jgi:hypothetical protein
MPKVIIVSPSSVSEEWEIICPDCKQDDSIHIHATAEVLLTRRGTEPVDCDTVWDDASIAHCTHCGFTGTVRDFEEAFKALPSGGR